VTLPAETRVITTQASDLPAAARELLAHGYRLAIVAAHDDDGRGFRVVYVFVSGPPDTRVELHVSADAANPNVPTLADMSFPASRFEREIRDLFGIAIDGHPQPAPLVLHQHWPAGWHPMRADAGPIPAFGDETRPFPFLTVEGDGVYEIPVGPVHAGLIEPGHFRFSVVGETILNMKARLWFVHKGIEKLFQERTVTTGTELAERISGDTAVGHALAYSLAVEQACDLTVPDAAQTLRVVLLELERIYNHVADIGAMCNDVGFGIIHSHTQRIRERLLRINAATTGHRLLRGGVYPGGAAVQSLPNRSDLNAIEDDIAELVAIARANSTVIDRFTGTGVLTSDQAADLATLGYVARAAAIEIDARKAHPFTDLYQGLDIPTRAAGDVRARFDVRVAELEASFALLERVLPDAQAGSYAVANVAGDTTGGSGLGLVEGWRGTIAHRVEIGPDGRLRRVKVVDPSFFNWPALPVALTDTIVPDFPLTNKSFNLSYAGNDL